MSRGAWTPTDEANFQALQARRDAVTVSRRIALEKAVGRLSRAIGSPFGSVECARIADDLICHAYEIRKALEPYDSGPQDVAASPAEPALLPPIPVGPPIEHNGVIDATKPGYVFTRAQDSEAEQVQLRD